MIGCSLTMPLGAVDLAGELCALAGHPDVVTLGEGHRLVPHGPGILHPPQLQREQLTLDDLVVHPNELLLLDLMCGDRPAAELDAVLA